jgi:hypothetical protein
MAKAFMSAAARTRRLPVINFQFFKHEGNSVVTIPQNAEGNSRWHVRERKSSSGLHAVLCLSGTPDGTLSGKVIHD